MGKNAGSGESSRAVLWTSITVAYAAVVLFPIFWMASMMVKPNDAMFARPTVWLFAPTLEHFNYVLAQGFHWSLLTSFVLCLVSTALVVVIGTPAAYAFARFEMKLKDDLFLFILATRMAPPVCLVIPFYLIFAKLGLLDTFIGLTLAYMTFNLSFYVWVLRSFCRDHIRSIWIWILTTRRNGLSSATVPCTSTRGRCYCCCPFRCPGCCARGNCSC